MVQSRILRMFGWSSLVGGALSEPLTHSHTENNDTGDHPNKMAASIVSHVISDLFAARRLMIVSCISGSGVSGGKKELMLFMGSESDLGSGSSVHRGLLQSC